MSPAFPIAKGATSQSQRTPDFLVWGAPRCGTTTLQKGLQSHPQLWLPEHKEPGFFAFDQEQGYPHSDYYASHWPQYQAIFDDAPADALVGEATPFYLALARAAESLAKRAPNCKLIICLRDPVERAWSHHQFHVRKGVGKRRFWDAWSNNRDLQPGGWSQGWALREFGMYAQQLEALWRHIPREQCHIISMEELRSGDAWSGIFAFLGVPPHAVPPMSPLNQGGARRAGLQSFHEGQHWSKRIVKAMLPRSVTDALWRRLKRATYRRSNMPVATRRKLAAYYTADQHMLAELLE